MLLHPESLDLAPCAAAVLARLDGDPRFRPELPAAQLEIVLPPAATVGEAATALTRARADLAAAAEGLARPAGAGVHPFAAVEGELAAGERYDEILRSYGWVARRQLVFGLHVHVAVRPAARALAVYNALRSYLPLIAALAANAPFYAGADTGMASARPTINDLLPRQGVPPSMGSWEELEAALATVPAGQWWWEARLHPIFGTVEVRAPDTQTTVAETASIAAVVHALVAWLAERHAAGEELAVAPSWRIAENRWSAYRHGLDGTMADLVTGEPEPTCERAAALLAELAPAAGRVGCAAELAAARAALPSNGAARQREAAAAAAPAAAAPPATAAPPGPATPRAVTSWLAGRFLG